MRTLLNVDDPDQAALAELERRRRARELLQDELRRRLSVDKGIPISTGEAAGESIRIHRAPETGQ